ncbi:MAG: C45 family autoproteolytic acyltransferase/hydrolase [Candidatus Hodarchaeota archaeon]
MYRICFKGSYYEIGLSNGKQLIAERERGFPPKFSRENLERSKDYEKVVHAYCPDLLDELRGMAESCGVNYQVLVALELTPYRLNPSCLVFAITGEHTQSGRSLLVRNHEWLEEDSKYLTICTVKPNRKIASFGFTFHWPLLSRYGGINEAGLTISSATTSFVNSGPGVMLNIATRWILDNFKTTEDAVEFIEEIPKVWGNNYLIIDKHDTLAKIETHRQKTLVTYPANGFDMITLTYEDPEMRLFIPDETRDILDLFNTRRQFLNQWFKEHKGNIKEETIFAALKSCENQLHYHEKAPNGTFGTCWSWILSPQSKEAWISQGPPCKNEFKSHNIEYSFTSQQ